MNSFFKCVFVRDKPQQLYLLNMRKTLGEVRLWLSRRAKQRHILRLNFIWSAHTVSGAALSATYNPHGLPGWGTLGQKVELSPRIKKSLLTFELKHKRIQNIPLSFENQFTNERERMTVFKNEATTLARVGSNCKQVAAILCREVGRE